MRTLKKRKQMIVGVGILVSFAFCIALLIFPQRAVQAAYLEQAEVFILNQNGADAKQLSASEMQHIKDTLSAIKIFGIGNKLYRYYTGSSRPMFRIVGENGTVTEVSAGSPFFIRNARGYYINYADAECIGAVYAELSEKYYAETE